MTLNIFFHAPAKCKQMYLSVMFLDHSWRDVLKDDESKILTLVILFRSEYADAMTFLMWLSQMPQENVSSVHVKILRNMQHNEQDKLDDFTVMGTLLHVLARIAFKYRITVSYTNRHLHEDAHSQACRRLISLFHRVHLNHFVMHNTVENFVNYFVE